MTESASPLVFIVFAVLIVGIAVAGHLHQKKVRREYERWAAGHGFGLRGGRVHGMDEAFPTLECLRKGSNRYAYDLLTGQWRGRAMRAFHYHYEVYTHDSKGRRQTHHHHLTVAAVTSELPLQHLEIRPEGILDKVVSFFGMEDINFESAEFSRRFHVSAGNRKWAYDIIHTRSMEHLLERPARLLSMNGDYVAGVIPGVYKPEAVEEVLDTMCGLLDLVPEYVRRQQEAWKTT